MNHPTPPAAASDAAIAQAIVYKGMTLPQLIEKYDAMIKGNLARQIEEIQSAQQGGVEDNQP